MCEGHTTRQIEINNLQMMVNIGVGEQERSSAQPIRFDVILTLADIGDGVRDIDGNLTGPLDDLAESVDYVSVLEIVDGLVRNGPRRKLLETLANDIALRCVGLEKVKSAEVVVTKLMPPVTFELQSVSARIKLAKSLENKSLENKSSQDESPENDRIDER